MTAKPQRRAAFELARGAALGKYEIVRKLAAGGMAEIYLARVRGQAGFEKLVVLKRILPHIADDPAFVAMFLDEARLAATLQHPNIADVYEIGEAGGELFFTMEFVHGHDVRTVKMAARKRNESVPLAIGLAIVHGTASALDYAHAKRGADGQLLGLVHRDVSTSNVMISYDGAIKLLDFGIARATVSRHKTQTGTLKGKVPYMSPEQCRGQPLDRRSDLFSLGVLLFELTVGRRPFRGDSDFEIMDQIVNHGAPPPSSVIRGYPPELEAIVMKLLARRADDRYQTAEDMIHELEPFLAQHQLWVSSKPLGKYMRLVFADQMAAWEAAEAEGLSFAEHVGDADTSHTHPSALGTPLSSFPEPRPLSKEIPAVRTSSSAVEPSKPVPVYPELGPSGGRRIAFALAGLAVGVLGILAVYVLTSRPASEPSAPPSESQAAPAPPAPPAPPTPKVTPIEPKPAAAAVEEPVAAVPAPVVAPPPEVAPPKPAPVATKPIAKRTPVVKQVVKKPKDAPADKPKDEGWDPNSPFLPPN